MPHDTVPDLAATAEVQPGAVVSKVIHRDEALNVTVFAFDQGEGLSEHTASRPAIVHVLDGRMRVTVDGETFEAGPGFWLHMGAGTPHELVALAPSRMLLTLV
jgi:quercetin dioxygenase-like cupin family protein